MRVCVCVSRVVLCARACVLVRVCARVVHRSARVCIPLGRWDWDRWIDIDEKWFYVVRIKGWV